MKNIMITTFFLSGLLVGQVQARNASIEDQVSGLYVAYFDRAADETGLNFWVGRANTAIRGGGNTLAVLKELSAGFATHPLFTSTYSHLANRAFVSAIYQNALGLSGDEEGINYWTGRLANGLGRSDMVAEFIDVSLRVDLTPANFPTLNTAELSAAQERQNLIVNQVAVATQFTSLLGSKSNVTNNSSPENDPAYKASICILKTITANTSSVSSTNAFLSSVASQADVVTRVNARCDGTSDLLKWDDGNWNQKKWQ